VSGKKLVEGTAKILAYDGVYGGGGRDLRGNQWVYRKYIVEVRPEGEDAFRATVKARVIFLHGPVPGDVVRARYDVGSRRVKLLLEGDPRYDSKLLRAEERGKRDELLHGNPEGPTATGTGPTQQELEEPGKAEPPDLWLDLTAQEILQRGSPCEAVIVQSQPLRMKSPVSGLDLHGFVLTIIVPGKLPYQITVGNPVPSDAVPLIFPGSRLPARFLADGVPEAVAIDWQTALANFTSG
jgi:hypothetical protein